MSDNLKIQKFKIITIKNFCQELNVCCFCYINCEREPKFGRFLCIINAKTIQPLVRNQGLCRLCSAAKPTENYSERKTPTFWFMEKHLSYNFHLWKNVIIEISYNVLHVWHCIEMYDKKFLI